MHEPLRIIVFIKLFSVFSAVDLQITTLGHLYPYPKECSVILSNFANDAANLTLCSIENARPIRLCEKCIGQYESFKGTYNELLQTTVNNTLCRDVLMSQDRLNAVFEYHKSILAIWNKGNCNDCFTWTDTSPVLSNNTVKFNMMYNDTMDCITTHLERNNSANVCEECMQSYLKLDDFYKSLSVDHVGIESVCMDIIDSMNATRSIWSKTLSCCKLRKSPELIFLCCTGIISFLPVLYYLSVRYCGPIRDLPNVLRQSRFKQTLLRSGNTNRNQN